MENKVWLKNYDQGVPENLECEDISLAGILERTAHRFPHKQALLFMNLKMSYAELKDQVDRLATAMARLGVKRESAVAIQLPNVPQTVIAFHAVQVLGARAVMTNPLYMAREIEHQWNDAGVDLAICADFLYDQKIKPIKEKLPAKNYIIASIPEYLKFPLNLLAPFKLKKAKPTPLIANIAPAPDIHFFKKLVDRTAPNPPRVDIKMDDIACLQYTGGTTGVSKGAILTQRNLSYNAQQCRAWFPDLLEGGEVFLGALPYFHIFGLTTSMNLPIISGAAMVLIPNPRDIPNMIKNIAKFRVSMMPAVPAIFNSINNHPEIRNFNLKSVRFCFSGSAPLPIEVLETFERLTGSVIVEGFGLTETSPVTHINPLSGERKVGSIGIPISSTVARVVDIDDGKTDKAVGEEGELIIQGPQVMAGYWKRDDETAGMIKDGWIYTGDLATMDEDGYFKIVGRKKDMIIAGGYNIYPDEIDNTLMTHPAVLEVATIGIPDKKRGETVKSFVVFKPEEKKPSWEELETFCRENLAAYKIPKLWEEKEELPKSTVLKILRRELRDEELKKLGQ